MATLTHIWLSEFSRKRHPSVSGKKTLSLELDSPASTPLTNRH
ncbi:MAG: hypothetical protein ACRCWP_04945 [Shewanella sp.]